MGKNKLRKFAEAENFSNFLQPPFEKLLKNEFQYKGSWNSAWFGNENPVVVELGCGKGEYTVGLAEMFPDRNYIGIDIKGARIYSGAKDALTRKLENVAFVRTKIENSLLLFGKNEISEIWLTFPDPQLKKVKKRLTSTFFINRYLQFLKPGGVIHLKTDSIFLYQYTLALARLNRFEILTDIPDIYTLKSPDRIVSITTFYEKQWVSRGITVKYLAFIPEKIKELQEPGEDFEKEGYRSFGRSAIN